MTLSEKQRLFGKLLGELLHNIYAHGYSVSVGYAERSLEEQERLFRAGRTKQRAGRSCHNLRLAVDLNLFNREGVLLSRSEDHQPFGEFWESLHPLCRWGGRFGDGNHYSIIHNGIR